MKFLILSLLLLTQVYARCLKSHVVDYKNGEFAKEHHCVPYPEGDSYCRSHYGKNYKATLSSGCELQTSFDFPDDILIELGLLDPKAEPKDKLSITTRDLYLHECGKTLTGCECPTGVKVEETIYTHSPKGTPMPMLSCQPLEQVADDIFQKCLPIANEISGNLTIEQICNDPDKKEELAQNCFDFILPATLKYTKDFPIRCWYSTSKFSANFGQFKRQLKRLLDSREDINCNYSICTTSTALMMANYYRDYGLDNKNLDDKQKEEVYKKIWNHINISATPHELVEELKIGTGHTQHASLGEIGTNLLPQPGDFVQIWRNNKPVTGHSVIFKGFTKNADNSVREICYFSSQPATRGYGVQCEDIKRVDKLLIGHLTAAN